MNLDFNTDVLFYISKSKYDEKNYCDIPHEVLKLENISQKSDYQVAQFLTLNAVDGMYFELESDAVRCCDELNLYLDGKNPYHIVQYAIKERYSNYLRKLSDTNNDPVFMDFNKLNKPIDDWANYMEIFPTDFAPNCLNLQKAQRLITQKFGADFEYSVILWFSSNITDEQKPDWFVIPDTDNNLRIVHRDDDMTFISLPRIYARGSKMFCEKFIHTKLGNWKDETDLNKALELYFSHNIDKPLKDVAKEWAEWGLTNANKQMGIPQQ